MRQLRVKVLYSSMMVLLLFGFIITQGCASFEGSNDSAELSIEDSEGSDELSDTDTSSDGDMGSEVDANENASSDSSDSSEDLADSELDEDIQVDSENAEVAQADSVKNSDEIESLDGQDDLDLEGDEKAKPQDVAANEVTNQEDQLSELDDDIADAEVSNTAAAEPNAEQAEQAVPSELPPSEETLVPQDEQLAATEAPEAAAPLAEPVQPEAAAPPVVSVDSPAPQQEAEMPPETTTEIAQLPPSSETPSEASSEVAQPEVAEPQTSVSSDESIAEVASKVKRVRVTDLQLRSNPESGTLIIQANGPLEHNYKINPQTNQFVIELENGTLPKKFQRPFNAKDIPGQIAFIDAYQLKGGNPRIVIQLRPGATEPVVEAQKNALFITAPITAEQAAPAEGGEPTEMAAAAVEPAPEMPSAPVEELAAEPEMTEPPADTLLSAASFEEFLRSNQKFYGNPISLETDDMDLREIFKLISEEAGINLVISDDVKGKMSLKLKRVPWDQALVMILKTKKLGYTRSGSVLRIAPVEDLRNEEEEAIKLALAKKNNAPVRVKSITVNYAKVEDLEKQVKSMLSPKGVVVADPRTSSIVVNDLEDNVGHIEQLIKTLDIPPQQVLIEGKIVEATDNFERKIGVSWGASGRTLKFDDIKSSSGALRFTPGISVTPGGGSASTMGLNFMLGTLDILGDLTASLRLFELQGLVKVISSPRILTLHNEKAEIAQTTEIPLITASISTNGVATPIVNFKPVKLRLAVIPQVTNDGAVIMAVDVTREVIGEVVDAKTNARPVNSRSASSKVLLKNSQTAVIGGIYQNDVTESQNKVPGLADIPVLGWLFKNKSVDKRRSELLIFLTPRILGQMQSLPMAMEGQSSSIQENSAALDLGGGSEESEKLEIDEPAKSSNPATETGNSSDESLEEELDLESEAL